MASAVGTASRCAPGPGEPRLPTPTAAAPAAAPPPPAAVIAKLTVAVAPGVGVTTREGGPLMVLGLNSIGAVPREWEEREECAACC